jgi:hypothetical protein
MKQPSTQIVAQRREPTNAVGRAILDFVSQVPPGRTSAGGDVATRAQAIAEAAANRAGLTAGSLALPPGPLGWLTVLPELVAVWKIQAQMVSDIAATYGRQAVLGREQMLYCLFRHTAAQAFRDVVVRAGDRLLFRRATLKGLEYLTQRIGLSVSQRAIGKGMSRWLPLLGALGVGWYARFDTRQVARTAIAMFGSDMQVEIEEPDATAAETGTAGRISEV